MRDGEIKKRHESQFERSTLHPFLHLHTPFKTRQDLTTTSQMNLDSPLGFFFIVVFLLYLRNILITTKFDVLKYIKKIFKMSIQYIFNTKQKTTQKNQRILITTDHMRKPHVHAFLYISSQPQNVLTFVRTTTMASTFSPKHSHGYAIRSISLPTRSHPNTVRIEEELNKLKSWEVSSTSEAERIFFGLSGLAELYKCMEDLLKLPLTQQALSLHQNQKWVDELLDCPLRFLDILGETRDAMMLMKGNVRDLQSALRRRKVGDFVIENHVSSYWSLRRNTRKQCTKSLVLLKHSEGSSSSFPLDLNHHLSAVVRVVREASFITSCIFQSLVSFLSSPILRSKVNNKWTFVSRVMRKGTLVQNVNELEKVDLALCRMVMDNADKDFEAENIQCANKELEAVVVVIEGLENGLDCLFKRLINTRVSFLNIVSN